MDRDASLTDVDRRAGELTEAFARIKGMLLSQEDAVRAVEQLAALAKDMARTTVGAGASLFDAGGRRTSTGSTNEAVKLADNLQYQLGEGPCITAWATNDIERIDDTATETRWPLWCAAANDIGLRSVLTAPLVFRGDCIGAVKLYSEEASAFSDEDVRRLVMLSTAVATLLGVAQGPDSPWILSGEVQRALSDRQAIETATGMLMERHGTDHEAARNRLLAHSRRARQQLAEVARQVIAGELGGAV